MLSHVPPLTLLRNGSASMAARSRVLGLGLAFLGTVGVAWGLFLLTADQSGEGDALEVQRPVSDPPNIAVVSGSGVASGVGEPTQDLPLPPSTQQRARSYREAAQAFAVRDTSNTVKRASAQLETASPIVVFDTQLPADLNLVFPAFELNAARSELPDGGPTLLLYQSRTVPTSALAIEFVSVFVGEEWLGIFLAQNDRDCEWWAAEDLWAVQDDFGVHPLIGSIEGQPWTSRLFADFHGQSSDLRSIDWRGLPARGEAYDRQWKRQLHFSEVPERDGILFRYEGGHKYLPHRQSGRGNSAHHWNLLAYNIVRQKFEELVADAGDCVREIGTGNFPERWVARYDQILGSTSQDMQPMTDGDT